MKDDKDISKQENKEPSAENPFKLLNLKVDKVHNWAAGVPAVMASIADLFEEKTVLRGGKALFKMNQMGGFDCASCAWPDPDEKRSPIAEYCENGAKALAEEATTKTTPAAFFKEHSVYELSQHTDFELGHYGRFTEPMYLPKGGTHYQPISWEDAFKKIATHINALDDPNEAIFYTSGRTSNEASFVYQLFAKVVGTNNMPDCSNMCHETSGTGLSPTIGIGKGTVKLEDLHDAELIIIVGQNPGTNAPRMMSALSICKKKGGKIIAVNPLPESGLMGFRDPQSPIGVFKETKLSDLYLPVKINGDMAFFKAMEKMLLEKEALAPGTILDKKFMDDKTVGYDEFVQQFADYDLNVLAEESGLTMEQLEEAADLLAKRKKVIFCWGMGITQQPNGVDMVREMVNILLMKGSIGIPGAGVCPVRGHSNVQGNRTMLINEKPTQDQLDKLETHFGFNPPRENGYDVVHAIHAMHDGKIKFFFAMGGNFLSATPDTTYTARGMRKIGLTVSVSTKLNRTHLVHGLESIILPALAKSDVDIINGKAQIVSAENSMGVVQSSKGILKPVSNQLMNESNIVCNMALATYGTTGKVDWSRFLNNYDAIRDSIESCIPGFDNYNERVRQRGGFYLPNGPREGNFTSKVATGKASFTITELPVNTLEVDEYMMATTRTHDQFNTTLYGLDDRYRGILHGRRVVMMNEKDMAREGWVEGDKVDLFNYNDDVERIAPLFVVVPYPIPERNTMTYFPETNVLVSVNNVVKESNMPASKYVKIKIRPHDPNIFEKVKEAELAYV
ncbi:FdhF/YdeP family oxidoreductase [Rhizosphaericola mali]|uniref:FdhF/YdeP family oxidoreductase n=1 Tax=Rhizosphaericola mali TaxID=2545455 RepID=A0A5P2FYV8_9BACT|nr:FdhF/YdeP family oxidoreductase [Rhizosphaericola mali]QES88385.1 FdhF/YdeP family oxidoreductase [Rhizosphaericola mali]